MKNILLQSLTERNRHLPQLFLSGLRLVITATDRGTPRLAGSATLTVIIIDLNDNSPMIPLPRQIHVPEGKSAWQTLVGEIDPEEPGVTRPWLLNSLRPLHF